MRAKWLAYSVLLISLSAQGFCETSKAMSDVTAGEIVPVALTAKVISVNGVQLDEVTIQRLETAYRTRLVNGNFWYDPVSGLWGVWGGPAFGQIFPGLSLGGRLRFDASGGQTNIAINGRAIHPLEYRAIIASYGYAVPGRYWLDAKGPPGN
jgi:hypothetical protein